MICFYLLVIVWSLSQELKDFLSLFQVNFNAGREYAENNFNFTNDSNSRSRLLWSLCKYLKRHVLVDIAIMVEIWQRWCRGNHFRAKLSVELLYSFECYCLFWYIYPLKSVICIKLHSTIQLMHKLHFCKVLVSCIIFQVLCGKNNWKLSTQVWFNISFITGWWLSSHLHVKG